MPGRLLWRYNLPVPFIDQLEQVTPEQLAALTDAEMWDLEFTLCMDDRLYWLQHYGYIRDERTGTEFAGDGIIAYLDSIGKSHNLQPLILWPGVRGWPGQLDVAAAYAAGEDINVLKARQLGVSWLFEDIDAGDIMFMDNIRLGIIAQTEPYSFAHIARIRMVLDHQPPFLMRKRPAIGYQSKSQFGLLNPDTGAVSLVESYVATSGASRSIAAKRVRLEEFAFYENPGQVLTAVVGVAADTGGQVVPVSTGNGPGSEHHRLWIEGEKGASGFRNVFMPYDTRPDRDEAWYSETLAKMQDPRRMSQEFPREPNDAFVTHTGAIYPMFSISKHVREFDLLPDVPIVCGYDAGFNHPFIVIGQVWNGDQFRIYDELCPEKVTAYDLGVQLIQWFADHGLDAAADLELIYRDPSAAGDGATFDQLELWNSATTSSGGKLNAVADGIQTVREVLNRDDGMWIHPRCVKLIEQMIGYMYKDDEAERVKKIADHGVDSTRYLCVGVIGTESAWVI